MSVKFNNAKGSAGKNKYEFYAYKTGENTVRLVGGLLPRYIYWVKASNGKTLPFECLGFDRKEEAFFNIEKDYVQEYFPDLKCGWSYAIKCIDPEDGKVKILNLKRKLFEQIMTAAEDLGDPTDEETGWPIVFKKVKTGPHNFNVEYNLQVLKCKQKPLTDEEKEEVNATPSIDEMLPRPTPEEQKKALGRIFSDDSNNNTEEDPSDELPDEKVSEEFDIE